MKKIIALVLVCLMLVSVIGCRRDDGVTVNIPTATEGGSDRPNDLAEKHGVKTMKDGKLVVGFEATYEPFEMMAEDGSYVGYDVDLAYELSDLLGLEVQFINTGFDGILDGIDVNYDCVISAITVNDERKEQVLFTEPYIENFQSIVVNFDMEEVITGFEDLNGAKVSLQEGTTSSDLMNALIEEGVIDASIIANPYIGKCFDSMKNGEIDYVVCDSTVAKARLAKDPESFRIAWTDDSNPEVFAIAVGKENKALADAFNEAISILKDEGFFEENGERWFA